MKARRYPMRPTTKPAAQVFALYGSAPWPIFHDIDRTEAVLMFFKDEESLVDFKSTLPGMYRKMTLEGVDYEALTVVHTEVLDRRTGSQDEPTCHGCDKPLTNGSKYCSFRCEESDRFPAPQDDQEKFTNPSTTRQTNTEGEKK